MLGHPGQLQCNGPNDENIAIGLRGCFPRNDHKPISRAAGPARTHVRSNELRIMSCNWPYWRKSAAECTAIPHASPPLSGRGSRGVARRGNHDRAPGYAPVLTGQRSDCRPDCVSQVPRALIWSACIDPWFVSSFSARSKSILRSNRPNERERRRSFLIFYLLGATGVPW
jgi:hypothetical protein